jgi:hypothetical protein
MYREVPIVEGTRIPWCSVGDIEGSGDGTIFQGLGLATEAIRNHLGRRGCDNVRSLECSNAGESLKTKSSPAD